MDQEIGALNREKNAITHPLSQIPGYATEQYSGCPYPHQSRNPESKPRSLLVDVRGKISSSTSLWKWIILMISSVGGGICSQSAV